MSKTKFSFWLDDGLKDLVVKYAKRDINMNISRIINKALELYINDIREKNTIFTTPTEVVNTSKSFVVPIIKKKKVEENKAENS